MGLAAIGQNWVALPAMVLREVSDSWLGFMVVMAVAAPPPDMEPLAVPLPTPPPPTRKVFLACMCWPIAVVYVSSRSSIPSPSDGESQSERTPMRGIMAVFSKLVLPINYWFTNRLSRFWWC